MSPTPQRTSGNLPLRTAPIIPVVPRSFERQVKQQLQYPTDEPSTVKHPKFGEKTDRPVEGKDETEQDQDLQIEISGDLNHFYGAYEADSKAVNDATFQTSVKLQDPRTSSLPNAQTRFPDAFPGEQPSLACTPSAAVPAGGYNQVTDSTVVGDKTSHPEIGGAQSFIPNQERLLSKVTVDGDGPHHHAVSSRIRSIHHELETSPYSDSYDVSALSNATAGSLASRLEQGQPQRQHLLLSVDTEALPDSNLYASKILDYSYSNDVPDTSPTAASAHHTELSPPNLQSVNGEHHCNAPPTTIPILGGMPAWKASGPAFEFTHPQWHMNGTQSLPFRERPYGVLDASSRHSHWQDHRVSLAHSQAPSSSQEASLATQIEDSNSIDDSERARTLKGDTSLDLSLACHILQNFDRDTFADCRLLLTHTHRFSPFRLSVHSLILSRSPTLGSLLSNGQYNYDYDGLKLLHVCLNDRFVTPSAFKAAIRVCYGEPVSSFTGPKAKDDVRRTKADFSVTWMDESLAFAAAGQLLQLRDVLLRGLEIAGRIINWDNIERALSFALEAGEHRKRFPSSSLIPNEVSTSNYDGDFSSTNTILTPSTSQNSPNTSFDSKGIGPKDVSAGSINIDSADGLLSRCLQFIATHLPSVWEFDPTARPLPHVDRLPITNETRSPLAKSRLCKIQFGDLPSEMATKISSHDSFISSILLSLPFVSLKTLADLEDTLVKQHLQNIVEERERRRCVVLRGSVGVAQGEATKLDEWDEVGYKEYVEMIQGEPRLSRAFVGIWTESADASLG